MSSKKIKFVESHPRLPESLLLLRAATKLYAEYISTVTPPAVHDIQLCRFGDYLTHFGFSLAKETPVNSMDNTLKGTKRLQAFFPEEELETKNASWGIPEDLKQEADARSADVDVAHILATAPEEHVVEELTKRIVSVFDRVSRTQSATHAAIKKTRSLYMWLAKNITVTLDPIVQEPSPAEGGISKAKPPSRKPTKQRGKITSNNADTKKKVNEKVAPSAVETVDQVCNPLAIALKTKITNPKLLAELYTLMLHHAGIQSRVVEGWLKGPSAEEVVEWAWNAVDIDSTTYLVDVAYSSYSGPLRKPKNDTTSAAVQLATKGKPVGVANAKKGPPVKKDPRKEDHAQTARPPCNISTAPASIPEFSMLTTHPLLVAWRRPVEDFYFFTNPLQFIHTHLPIKERDTFLSRTPTRVSWDLAPRQTHSIFQFGISLLSHRRNQCFTVRSTPVYLSFKNENPGNIQLCCVLYKGSLWDLPEDLHESTPLPPEFVWHQRCEKDNTETFTVTVSEGGFYSAVIGARYIREDPYTNHISNVSFTPIVQYQMKVNFVPIPVPTFPRQHLPPNLCRLMTPLSRYVLAGLHRFIVMPTCSNITAVALVRYIPPQTAGADLGELGDNANEDLVGGTRELVQLLHFTSENAIYEGEINLEPSTIIELWVLYQAPDKNGLTFQEKVAIEEKEKVPPPLPSIPEEKKPKKQQKSKPSVGETVQPSEDIEMEELLRELAAGRAFLPFITGIQGKTLLTRETGGVVQPQPSIESEKNAVMRRLAGVTPMLYAAASELENRQFRPVGGYYDIK